MKLSSPSLRRKTVLALSIVSVTLSLALFNSCSQSSKLEGQIENSSTTTPGGGITLPPQERKAKPSLHLDFNPEGMIAQIDEVDRPGLLVFSRNSIATYFGADGRVTVSSANSPRFSYDPNTCQNSKETVTNGCLRKYLGLQLEEAGSNWLLNSGNPAAWEVGAATTVMANAAEAPDGTMTATRLAMTDVDGSVLKQSGVPGGGKVYTFSVWARSNGRPQLTMTYAGKARTVHVINLSNQWQRYSWTFTADQMDAGKNSSIELNNDFSGGLVDAFVWGAQLEEGRNVTSYIPTTATRNVVRTAERLTLASDHSWFSQMTGSWWIDWHGQSWGGNSFEQVFFTYSTLTGDHSHKISRRPTETSGSFQVKVAGLDTGTPASTLSWPEAAARRGSFGGWDSTVLSVAESNGLQTMIRNSSLTDRPSGMSVLTIGGFNGHVRGFKFFKSVLSQADLNDLANSLK